MEKKKVLLVDDSAAMRNSVRPLFDSHPSFDVVEKPSTDERLSKSS
jgi:hypothetical protein